MPFNALTTFYLQHFYSGQVMLGMMSRQSAADGVKRLQQIPQVMQCRTAPSKDTL